MNAPKALAAIARECEAVALAQEALLDEAASCTNARQRAALLELADAHEQDLIKLDRRSELLADLL